MGVAQCPGAVGDPLLGQARSVAAGTGPLLWEGKVGKALRLDGGTAVLGGVTVGVGGLESDGTLIVTAVPDEPTLRVVPDAAAAPGATGHVAWTCPAGAPGVLFVSLSGGLVDLSGVDRLLWGPLPAAAVLSIGPGPAQLGYTLPGDAHVTGTVL